MNKKLRTAELIGNLNLTNSDWSFRVYLMRGDLAEIIDHNELFQNLEDKVKIILEKYLTDEFEYIRSGFILAHYGRRGVTYSIWHWADWCGTWEYFCQAWYCYGRELSKMESLDRKEPILCQHEIDIVMLEGKIFWNLVQNCLANDQLIHKYRNCIPNVNQLS